MVTSNAAAVRKGSLLVAASGIYIAACYIGYKTVQSSKQDSQETELAVKDGLFSFVSNPNRTQQFQHVAEKYDDEVGRDESVMGINLLRRSLLYFHAKGTVLEVGAGTGRNIPYYPSSSVDRVLMTDTSDKMLAKAQLKIKDIDKPQFACRVSDGAHLREFPDHSVDTVVDTFGLCSYNDPVQVLKEMKRICKPDGKVLLLEHGRSKTWSFITNYLDKNAERHAKNWGCVWNRDLDQIVEESGLHLETLHTWHLGTTYYMVCRPGTKQ